MITFSMGFLVDPGKFYLLSKHFYVFKLFFVESCISAVYKGYSGTLVILEGKI